MLNVPEKYFADYVGHDDSGVMFKKVYGHIMVSKKTSVEEQMQAYFEKFLSKCGSLISKFVLHFRFAQPV